MAETEQPSETESVYQHFAAIDNRLSALERDRVLSATRDTAILDLLLRMNVIISANLEEKLALRDLAERQQVEKEYFINIIEQGKNIKAQQEKEAIAASASNTKKSQKKD